MHNTAFPTSNIQALAHLQTIMLAKTTTKIFLTWEVVILVKIIFLMYIRAKTIQAAVI
jgi:hypothetical protein